MRISDWSSDVCSSDLMVPTPPEIAQAYGVAPGSMASGAMPAGLEDWNDWLDKQTPDTDATAVPRNAMIYTSGTTGRPKGVRREKPTPEQVAANTVAIGTYYGLKSGQIGRAHV